MSDLATNAATLRANLDKLPEKDRAFARSLLADYAAGRCSEKQAHWIATLARRASGSEPAPTAIDVSGIEALLGRSSAKHPAILLRTTAARPVRISVAGAKSKTPGAIMVTGNGPFETRPYYGKILNGVFIQGKNEPATIASVTALLLDFSRDPAATAAEYGRSTGVCSFCARQLTDDRSVSVGYGPICAETYHLPWGA